MLFLSLAHFVGSTFGGRANDERSFGFCWLHFLATFERCSLVARLAFELKLRMYENQIFE
jgi:hypothetical protein